MPRTLKMKLRGSSETMMWLQLLAAELTVSVWTQHQ